MTFCSFECAHSEIFNRDLPHSHSPLPGYPGITLPLAYRKKQLQRLYDLVKENEALLLKALHKDLRKHAVESIGAEIAPVTEECLWFLEVHCPSLKHFDMM